MSETRSPLTEVPSSATRQEVSVPYCDPASFHQDGVSAPRRSPKSPGDVQLPMRCSFTQSEMSEGQFVLVPGTSDDTSRLNSTARTGAPASLALFGNLYSTWPRPNQSSAACMRRGSRKACGTSSSPITPLVEQSPHGAVTWQLV